ncbi:putative lectin [Phytophthora cinnamomi]|uniref:putative lectin n=1 Tax=Phytophthora cinnamomi TaxID=4785 RepID=UPI003559F2BC|nr:putative lectin [Phytophthora cinnamomi]
MQLFSLASVALLALTAVQAMDMSTLHLRVYNSGVSDWGACTGNIKGSNPTSVCVKYSQYYAQCKPSTLPQGELCGQNDGTSVWKYDHCPSNQQCKAVGTDFRCSNTNHHQKDANKDASCTITNESQCDGQNWTGSTCCADPSYECRWSDDGQNVKRCQKIAENDDDDSTSDDAVIIDDSDYSDSESDDVVTIDDSDNSDNEDSIDSGSED